MLHCVWDINWYDSWCYYTKCLPPVLLFFYQIAKGKENDGAYQFKWIKGKKVTRISPQFDNTVYLASHRNGSLFWTNNFDNKKAYFMCF